MKKLFVLLALVALSLSTQAQDFSLDQCDRFTSKSTTLYKTAVFNQLGINLNKYDWQNPYVVLVWAVPRGDRGEPNMRIFYLVQTRAGPHSRSCVS